MLYFHLLGMIAMTICAAGDVELKRDLSLKPSNNRRIVHNAADDQRTQNKGKRLREATEPVTPSPPDEDEDKKTLSQQVADGKYGLIQTELFASPAERPGIISYEVNPEVPKDNVNNLGGLQPEEIWLAENHLLVLRGGGFGGGDPNQKAAWPPIDNYIAPQRQVKIPPNPKVPPPFPVQLKEGGPIEFIKGRNGTIGGSPFFDPRFGPPPFFPQLNFPADGSQAPGNFSEGNGGNREAAPLPYLPPPPGLGLYPPVAAFLPPPGNFTELDEDDPTIYYPPPYDFFYPKDNSSHVPAGPLVPGIILPPPPNFFSSFEPKNKSQHTKSQQRKPLSKSRPSSPQYGHEKPSVKSTQAPTKPPRIIITTTYKPTSTLAPIIVTTDSAQNEIPLRTLPPDTPVGGWVPIPAPRPFYISDIKHLKPSKSTDGNRGKTKYPSKGYDDYGYENSTQKGQILTDGWTREYEPQKKGRQYVTTTTTTTTTTERTYTGFKPMYTSTPPPYHSNRFISNFNSDRAPKEYFYYEEPHITEGKLVDQDYEQKNSPNYYNKNNDNYETNTLAPSKSYPDVAVKISSENGQNSPDYYDEYRKPISTTPPPPINYYVYNQTPNRQNQNPPRYSYEPNPLRIELGTYEPQEVEIGGRAPKSGSAKKLANQGTRTTTEKPPVYEYSFSAPGYGSIEAPKVGVSFGTTPKSIIFESNFTPIRDNNQYSNYFEYQNTPRPEYEYERPVLPTQYYTTPQNTYREKGRYHHSVKGYQDVPRNRPQDALLDDITKKYFTVFGQKLNSESLIDSVTTPLPPVHKQQYYNYQADPPSTTEGNRHIKFPDELYGVQNDQPYYPGQPGIRAPPPYRQSHRGASYPNYYRVSSPDYISQPYGSFDQVRPGHSLHSDINVNLKKPRPTLEPEAELIDPSYISSPTRGNSFISYQLPGSGGHFYFLTPQAVKQPPSFPPPGFPQISGYFKRHAPPSKSRRPQNLRKPSK